MKTVTDEYNGKELAVVRRPVELYNFTIGASFQSYGGGWNYTSGDAEITDDYGNIYYPAPIARSAISLGGTMEPATVTIQIAEVTRFTRMYLATNAVSGLWVYIWRVFRDQSPIERGVIFFGIVKRVSVKGLTASLECVSMDYLLSKTIPKDRYHPQCNHTVFDEECGLQEYDYEVYASDAVVGGNGFTLTDPAFDAFDDGYFNLGYIMYYRQVGEEVYITHYMRIMISTHVGDTLNLRYKFPDRTSGTVEVIALPGCNGLRSVCRDKYDNITHFLGFPDVPTDNPALWTGRGSG